MTITWKSTEVARGSCRTRRCAGFPLTTVCRTRCVPRVRTPSIAGASTTSTRPRTPPPAKATFLQSSPGSGERHRLGRLDGDRDEPVAVALGGGRGHVALEPRRHGRARRRTSRSPADRRSRPAEAVAAQAARVDPGRRDRGDLEVRAEARLDVEHLGNVGLRRPRQAGPSTRPTRSRRRRTRGGEQRPEHRRQSTRPPTVSRAAPPPSSTSRSRREVRRRATAPTNRVGHHRHVGDVIVEIGGECVCVRMGFGAALDGGGGVGAQPQRVRAVDRRAPSTVATVPLV